MLIQPTQKRKSEKRIGRGGKRGSYSGRGQKGQRARAGGRRPESSIEAVFRMPKFRGTKNRPAKEVVRIQVGDLEKYEKEGILTRDAVIRKARDKKKMVKILGEGEVKKAITVIGIKVSKSAEEKIKKAGGSVKQQ
ncbi:MAG: uL15m family ribosomal protein [Candidatus Wolfebacteria bacterium]|nr:uL15m family ribosomal protein [Candidatus Wolfebacteria bacterium]MDP2704689.1 uL15m family ribosomal protein [bacterium]